MRGGVRAARNSAIGCACLLAVIEGVGIGLNRVTAGNNRPQNPPVCSTLSPCSCVVLCGGKRKCVSNAGSSCRRRARSRLLACRRETVSASALPLYHFTTLPLYQNHHNSLLCITRLSFSFLVVVFFYFLRVPLFSVALYRY